ncbi:hypothetical protein ACFQ3S_17205 [Mucilaginibacter terrae]|uniref:hypothetical protein n=1 Tax=Mucilaginibacter terrae TaxID=1955052 RepID=UPI003640197D
MKPIDYFKLQSKNLHRDYKTQTSVFDATINEHLYEYNPTFFDFDSLVLDYDINKENFTLMKAQHVIAQLVGFSKWTEMLDASPIELELAKLLFDNMHKISAEEWHYYIRDLEITNNEIYDAEWRLGIFKQVFAEAEDHQTIYADYRLSATIELDLESEEVSEAADTTTGKIASLPLSGQDRLEFVEVANIVFKRIFERIEPENPEIVRKLWNPEFYIDNDLLSEDMLPIDRDYALSLIDAFLVGHVIQLAAEADRFDGN